MASPSKRIECSRSDGVATLVLDRPPVNVLDTEMMGELLQALDSIPVDETKLLVLRARGRAFSAGVEVGEHLGEALEPMLRAFSGLVRRLASLEYPVAAVVEGPCLGGACELILLGDFVLATEEARFGFPEIRLGVFPPVASLLLATRVGEIAARDLILTGRVVSAAEAWDMGLIWKVVTPQDLEEEAEGLVRTLAGLSGPVLRLAKRALGAGRARRFLRDLDGMEALFLEGVTGIADAAEGLRAFLEKRKPVWKDR